MSSDGLTDHRWDGYSDAELADVVDQLANGRGAEGMTRAANTLDDVAESLRQIDSTLVEQLGAIGVDWQSKHASGLASAALGHSRDYGAGAHGQVTVSARSVSDQSDAYTSTRRGLPDSAPLRQNPSAAVSGTSFTGNATDHTRAVRDRSQTRQQAIDALNNYGHSSRQNLAAHHPLPPVQQVHVSIDAPPVGSGTSASGYALPPICNPAGAGAANLAPGPVVGGAPTSPIPVFGNSGSAVTGAPLAGGGVSGPNTGGVLAFGAVPGGGANVPGGGASLGGGGNSPGGQPGSPNTPGFGGRMAGPVEGGGAPLAGGTAGVARGIAAGAMNSAAMNSAAMNNAAMNNAAMGAAVVGGVGGAAAAGTGAKQERLVRGRSGPRFPRGGDVVGAEPEEHAAASRTASKVGSTTSPRRSMLEPATGSSQDEEDGEHVRRFGVEADDLFADQRMVVAPVLGDDEDPAP